jgi:hypothetical protein
MAYSVFRVPNSITILPTTGNQIVSTIIAGSGQSVDLSQWQSFTGSVLARIDNAGNFSGVAVSGTNGNFTGNLTVLGNTVLGDAVGDTITISGTPTFVQNATFSGDIAVNGGDITTTSGIFNFLPSNATTVNLGAASTVTNIGTSAGTVNVGVLTSSGTINANGGTIATSQTTAVLLNTTATTVNAFGAATITNIGAGNGTITLGGTTSANTLNATGTINANGGTIATNQTTATLLNTTATTVNAFGASTSTNIGAGNGTVTIGGTTATNTLTATGTINANNGIIATNQSTASLYNVTATTVNLAGSATTLNIATGVMTSGTVNVATNNTSGTITIGASSSTTIIQGNLIVNGLSTTVNSTTINVDDLNINVAADIATAAAADGGGLTVGSGLGITMNYDYNTNNPQWTSSQNFNIANTKNYRIAGTEVLNATGLGSAVIHSTLQKVGTIATGVWNGSIIGTGFTQAQVVAVSGTAARTTVGGTASWPVVDLATVSQGATGTSFVKVGIDAYGRVINNTAVVSGDIPNLSAAQITAGTLAVARGGTNITSYTTGDILFASSSSTIGQLAATTSGLFLRTNGAGTAPTFYTLSSGDVTAALGFTPASSASGVTGSGVAGKVAVWSTAGAITFDTDLSYDSTNNVLSIGYGNLNGSNADVTVNASLQTLDTFASGTYRSAKYLIQTKNGVNHQVSEALVIHDGVNAYITEYGQIYTSGTIPLITLSATTSAPNIVLQAVGSAAGNTVRFFRTTINV